MVSISQYACASVDSLSEYAPLSVNSFYDYVMPQWIHSPSMPLPQWGLLQVFLVGLQPKYARAPVVSISWYACASVDSHSEYAPLSVNSFYEYVMPQWIHSPSMPLPQWGLLQVLLVGLQPKYEGAPVVSISWYACVSVDSHSEYAPSSVNSFYEYVLPQWIHSPSMPLLPKFFPVSVGFTVPMPQWVESPSTAML